MLYFQVRREVEIYKLRNNHLVHPYTLIKDDLYTKEEVEDLLNDYKFNPDKVFVKVNVSPKNTYFSFGHRFIKKESHK